VPSNDYDRNLFVRRIRGNNGRMTESNQRGMRHKRPRAMPRICRIDVTAFAAVMFALVAMFLLPAMMIVDHRGAGVDLPKVGHPIPMPLALREDAPMVAVLRDGSIWFGTDRLMADQLPSKIREALSRGAERRIYLRADARARYGGVAKALNYVQASGVENVVILAEQRKLSLVAR
jgi:biopolymer transport protein TolR